MALQDDIFDVAAALKGKPEAKQFERIKRQFYILETNVENQEKVLKSLSQGIKALRWIEEEIK